MTHPSSTTLPARVRRWLGWAVFVAGASIEAGHLVGFAHAAAAA